MKKLCRLEFLGPDGGTGLVLDNDPKNAASGAFIQSGWLTCRVNNGRRRTASVTLADSGGFGLPSPGTQVRLMEGRLMPDGTEEYLPQGVFEITNPQELDGPCGRTVTLQLTDKWVNLDGTLHGCLEGDHMIPAGTDVFAAMASVLLFDRYTMEANGAHPLDPVRPLFTEYYNGRTQTLTDGRIVSLTDTPYTILTEGGRTVADVLLGLAGTLAADIGYNAAGRLTVSPSGDDVSDADRPVLHTFSTAEPELLRIQYNDRPADVFNDIIVTGAACGARGRAQNTDPSSPTCVSRIGLRTRRVVMPDYYSDEVCEAYAAQLLRKLSAAACGVTLTCAQVFDISENGIITVRRDDLPGAPEERFRVQGFTRPLAEDGEMTVNAENCVG